MNTENDKNSAQMKKLGKIEGVIYVDDHSEQGGGETAAPSPAPQPAPQVSQPKPQEPTKGVQTYIPMSMYRRLNDLKLSRGETIGNLVIQAIGLWLDVQEGTKKVATTI